jgi:triosephosphate isomerase
MRTKFIAGNWKMNTNKSSAVALARDVAKGAGGRTGVELGVAPPFVYLDAVSQAIAGSGVLLGAQDAYHEKNGAFTGEISLEMLKELGVQFCLTGHSERRHVLHESSDLIAKKASAIYSAGMILVHCVGEKLDQRDADQTFSVVRSQIDELDTGRMTDPDRLVIAYEPVWAIGTGRNATDAQAQEVHAFIRSLIGTKWSKEFADRVRILYGGSLKPENAKGLLAQPDVDGGLIGGAALKPESFLAIADAAK